MNIDLSSILAPLKIPPETTTLVAGLAGIVLVLIVIKLLGLMSRLVFTVAAIVLSGSGLLKVIGDSGPAMAAVINTLTGLILVAGGLIIGGLVVIQRNPLLNEVLAARLRPQSTPAQPTIQVMGRNPAQLEAPRGQLLLTSSQRPGGTHRARPTKKRRIGGGWGF